MTKHIIRVPTTAFVLLLACGDGVQKKADDDRNSAQGTPSSDLPANTRPVDRPGGSNREMNPGSLRMPPEEGGAGQPGSNDKPDPMLGAPREGEAKADTGGRAPDR